MRHLEEKVKGLHEIKILYLIHIFVYKYGMAKLTEHNRKTQKARIARAKAMLKQWKSGVLMEDIAAQHGISKQRVWQLIQSVEESCRKPKIS